MTRGSDTLQQFIAQLTVKCLNLFPSDDVERELFLESISLLDLVGSTVQVGQERLVAQFLPDIDGFISIM